MVCPVLSVMAGAEEACAEPRGCPEKPDEEEGDHLNDKLLYILLSHLPASFIFVCMSFHHPVLLQITNQWGCFV